MTNYKQYFFSKGIIFISSLACFGVMNSCSNKISGKKNNNHFVSKNHQPDYSDLAYWAASPFKYDPSDNVPKSSRDQMKDSLADVFFIYPTTYTDRRMPMGWNAEIDDVALN
ncbi:MAG: hypothetical protein ABI297_08210, partial [Ginsengibacter sp.]